MTTELGLNLAGVERVLELELQLERAQHRLEQLEARSRQMRAELQAEMEAVRALAARRPRPGAPLHGAGARGGRPPAAPRGLTQAATGALPLTVAAAGSGGESTLR